MDDVRLADDRTMQLGEELDVGVVRVVKRDGSAFVSPTALLYAYDSAGAVDGDVNGLNMTITGTTMLEIRKTLTTGAGKMLTAAGDYSLEYVLTEGSKVKRWHQALHLLAVPAP